VHNAVARAAAFGDATLAPVAGPSVEVVATAKVDLMPGDELDGPGGYKTYGQCENASVVEEKGLLVVGISERARMIRPVAMDEVITRQDVELPGGRVVDQLRVEQDRVFGVGGDARRSHLPHARRRKAQ